MRKKSLCLALFAFMGSACTHTETDTPAAVLENEMVSCLYMPKDAADMETDAACGNIQDGKTLVFHPEFLVKLANPSKWNCIQVKAGSQWNPYYVLSAGKAMRTLPIDNACDDFSEGLARQLDSGKIRFFDENLEVTLSTQYEWAYPFQEGKAKVCRNVVWAKEGESQRMTAGECSFIDNKGELLSPFVAVAG